MTWHIGFDLDSVIYPDFQDEFERAANKRGFSRESDLTTWNTWEHYLPKMSHKQFWHIMAESISDGEMFTKGKPHPEAFDVMSQFISEGHHVYIVTARHVVGAELQARRITFEWIENHLKLPYSGILISRNKAILPLHSFIDDSPKNCAELAAIGCFPVAYDQPWNQEWDGPRAYSLWDFYSMTHQELSSTP